MSEVRAKYGQLNEVLGTFNEKVSEVLSKAEVQFLQAYRANMQAVYEEKRELEAKLAEAGRQQSNDQQMRNLERDREWYKDRKNKLENQAVAMQKDLLYMHGQHAAFSKEIESLSSRLKAARKADRLGKAEGAARKAHLARKTDFDRGPENNSLPHVSANPRGSPALSGRGGMLLVDPDKEDEHALRRELRVGKEELLRERAEVARLKSLVVADKSQRSELEDLYLSAVEDLRKEALRSSQGGQGGQRGDLDGQLAIDLTLLYDALFPGK